MECHQIESTSVSAVIEELTNEDAEVDPLAPTHIEEIPDEPVNNPAGASEGTELTNEPKEGPKNNLTEENFIGALIELAKAAKDN